MFTERIQDKNQTAHPIYALAFRPNHPHLVVASGPVLLLYDTTTWSLISMHHGHTEPIYALDFTADGQRLVSGGADKSVIIWKNMDAVLRYHHSESIQAVRFNPSTGQIASCSGSDYGIWSPDAKSVTKYKVRPVFVQQ